MKQYILILLIILFSDLHSQVLVENGNLEITLTSGRKASGMLHQGGSVIMSTRDFKIIAKVEFKNYNDSVVDLNKFSLIDHNNKIRFRGSDFNISNALGWHNGIMLQSDDIGTSFYTDYKPEIRDSFYDYSIPNYTNYERKVKLRFSKKSITQLYYPHLDSKLKKIRLYFILPRKIKEKQYDLYYESKKIGTIKI